MVAVILINQMMESKIRSYDTNSFDEATRLLLDDWVAGKIVWEYDDLNEAMTPEWLKSHYPTDDIEPLNDKENGVGIQDFWYCGATESDDLFVHAYFIKSMPVQDGEWLTNGICN